MIRLTTPSAAHYVSTENIARITEAGASSQWHGIRAFVKLFDGTTLECCESADQIAKLVADVTREKP